MAKDKRTILWGDRDGAASSPCMTKDTIFFMGYTIPELTEIIEEHKRKHNPVLIGREAAARRKAENRAQQEADAVKFWFGITVGPASLEWRTSRLYSEYLKEA